MTTESSSRRVIDVRGVFESDVAGDIRNLQRITECLESLKNLVRLVTMPAFESRVTGLYRCLNSIRMLNNTQRNSWSEGKEDQIVEYVQQFRCLYGEIPDGVGGPYRHFVDYWTGQLEETVRQRRLSHKRHERRSA